MNSPNNSPGKTQQSEENTQTTQDSNKCEHSMHAEYLPTDYQTLVIDETSPFIEKGYIYNFSGSLNLVDRILEVNKPSFEISYVADTFDVNAQIPDDELSGAKLCLACAGNTLKFFYYIGANGKLYRPKKEVKIEAVIAPDDDDKEIAVMFTNKQIEERNKKPMTKNIDVSTDDGTPLGNTLIAVADKDQLIYFDSSKTLYIFDKSGTMSIGTGKISTLEKAREIGLIDKTVNFLKQLPNARVRVILKCDAYLQEETLEGRPNIEFILDGGNLHRFNKKYDTPKRIVCKNGSFINTPTRMQIESPREFNETSGTYIKDAGMGTRLSLFGNQSNVAVDINVMDFVCAEDYQYADSAKSINLNNVLDRIFHSVYISNSQNQRLTIKMPANMYGFTSFIVDHSVVIPYGVTLDMSGATVYVHKNFCPNIRKKNVNGLDELQANGTPGARTEKVDYIFSFGTNYVYPILPTSVVKNLTIMLPPRYEGEMKEGKLILKETKSLPDTTYVFDLTNFKGEMENVEINMNNHHRIVAFWQPYGNGMITYSDQKIFRRCKIFGFEWRTVTPTAILCSGDGCIIEQCNLGYVAILGGRSYTIKGCLNDHYFLFDTIVDFNGSYWEVGQFEILDSRVNFANCRLDAQNNLLDWNPDCGTRKYVGPWMSVDTDGCRERLKYLVEKYGLDLYSKDIYKNENTTGFNEIPEEYRESYPVTRIANFPSIVRFEPNITFNDQLWGYKQPMAAPLIKVGETAKIIGAENLKCHRFIYLNNDINTAKQNSGGEIKSIAPQSYLATTHPLINGDFADIRSTIEVPEAIFVYGNQQELALGAPTPRQPDNSYQVTQIKLRCELDRERALYSKVFECSSDRFTPMSMNLDMETKETSSFMCGANAVMSNKMYSNLKMEIFLTVSRKKSGMTSTLNYMMRQHFADVNKHDIIVFPKSGTQKDITPAPLDSVTILNLGMCKAMDLDQAVKKEDGFLEPPMMTLSDIHINDKLKPTAIIPSDESNGKQPRVWLMDYDAPSDDALCDMHGNVAEPGATMNTQVNVATKVEWLNDVNVRAYLSARPKYGTWHDGDQVVVSQTTEAILYTYLDGAWCETAKSLKRTTIVPLP